MEEIIDDDIFQELEQIYGLGLEAKEILRSYIEFVKLKETGQLERNGTTQKETGQPEKAGQKRRKMGDKR